MKVLHVTDCFNGGVQEVIEEIMSSVLECEHYLLFDFHDNDPHESPAAIETMKSKALVWKRGAWNRVRHLRSVVNDFSIDIVHLHSSRAGFYGRISLPRKLNIYTSHGFGFERKDISILFRSLILVIEFCLRFKTAAYIANWPNEYKIARRLHSIKRVRYSPVILKRLMDMQIRDRNILDNSLEIATIGRITHAKDPSFFREVCINLKDRKDLEWHWLGDGPSSMKLELKSAGIQVSGWLSNAELRERLEKIRIILITSLWDAGPITLYLAISLGIPVIVRDFPAGKILGFGHGWTSKEISSSLRSLIESRQFESFSQTQRDRAWQVMNQNSPENLGQIYQMVRINNS